MLLAVIVSGALLPAAPVAVADVVIDVVLWVELL
jgi:hypothetical protein